MGTLAPSPGSPHLNPAERLREWKGPPDAPHNLKISPLDEATDLRDSFPPPHTLFLYLPWNFSSLKFPYNHIQKPQIPPTDSWDTSCLHPTSMAPSSLS